MSSSSRVRARGTVAPGHRSDAAVWRPGELDDPAAEADGIHGATDPAAGLPGESPEPQDPSDADTVDLQAEIDAAYTRGYEDGRAEGTAVEAARLGSALMALDEAVQRFEQQQPAWLESLEKNMVALATAMARQVIGREVSGKSDDVAALVHRALAEFPIEATVRVRLNPADLSAISSPQRGDAVQAGRQVRWMPDPGIAPGGCLVEGPESLVDGRVEKALERIYTALVYG